MQRILRPMGAFVFRNWHLTRRYLSWEVVFVFYAVVSAATIALIGVAAKDFRMTLNLTMGALLWAFLSAMYHEISLSIAYERWEGTLEYTFMAPVHRLTHLAGVSISAVAYSILRAVIVLGALVLFIPMSLQGANLLGILLVLVVGSLAFMGLGLMAAVLPLMSPERGAEAVNILQGLLLLVSGVYYPVSVLPKWLQPCSALSPATYALTACRKLLGTANPASRAGDLLAAPVSGVLPEMGILLVMGVALIPLGLLVFNRAEAWAKHTGKLKRTG
jgi:ABC-2 type transport system permease protein